MTLQLTPAEFEECVAEAFKLRREGTVVGLEASPLANSSLVADCLLPGETSAYGARGRALQSILHWAVAQIKPTGQPNPTAVAWRSYNLLTAFYLEGAKVSDTAELLGIVETHFYEVRRQALTAVSAVIYEEICQPRSLAARRRFVLADAYSGLNRDDQTLVRAAAIFQRPVPAGWLLRLIGDQLRRQPSGALTSLSPVWLLTDAQGSEIFLRPESRDFVASLLSDAEAEQWHKRAAEIYLETREDALTAAHHWRAAKEYIQAAQLLIRYAGLIVAESGLDPLYKGLAPFRPHELRAALDLWAQIKLLAGETAEGLEDLTAAAAEYNAALQTGSAQFKARACYRLAKLFERNKRVDEALAAYQRGLSLSPPADPLLVALHIGRAWIFIQTRPDKGRAEADLRQAEALLQPDDLAQQADWHNGWAGFYTYLEPSAEQAIAHRLQYWLLASELGDLERQLKAALGVGQDYLYEGRYAEGLSYLQQGLSLAAASGNRGMEGQYQKVMGAAHFFQGDYAAAWEAYQRARTILLETGNRQWLAHTYHDLAETAVELDEWEAGRRYWQEGWAIAEALGDESARRNLAALAEKQPRLKSTRLTAEEREARLLAYLAEQGQISNGEYQALTGVQKAQAARDLKAWAAAGRIKMVGKGPATRYMSK